MTEHNDPIRGKIETLTFYRASDCSVVILMKDDPDLRASVAYWADVGHIDSVSPKPSAELIVSRFVVSYFTDKHMEADNILGLLHSAREEAEPFATSSESLLSDFTLRRQIESAVGVVHSEQVFEFPRGLMLQVAISGMRMITGTPRTNT